MNLTEDETTTRKVLPLREVDFALHVKDVGFRSERDCMSTAYADVSISKARADDCLVLTYQHQSINESLFLDVENEQIKLLQRVHLNDKLCCKGNPRRIKLVFNESRGAAASIEVLETPPSLIKKDHVELSVPEGHWTAIDARVSSA